MEIFVTNEFLRRYQELDRRIQRKIIKQQQLFTENPFHPSLNTEKLIPKKKEVWSIRVDKKYRIMVRFHNAAQATFLTVGSHDWIYKQI